MATKEKWPKVFHSWHQYKDNVAVYFGDDKDALLVWDGDSLNVTGALEITGDVQITGDLDLTTSEDISVMQGYYIYLDGTGGGEYVVSDTANDLTLNATNNIYLAVGGTDEILVTNSDVTLYTNDFALSAGDIAVAEGYVIYLDGLDGAEYLVSDVSGYLTAKATTGIYLAIGTTDEVTITNSAVTMASSNLTLDAGRISVAQGYAVYLDGQGGDEYLVSDASGEAMLTADTEVNLAIDETDVLTIAAASATFAQKIVQDDTTDSSSTSTGSIQTDGGLGVAKAIYAGTNIYLASGAIMDFNSDVTLTHSSNTLTLAGGNLAVAADDFITGAPTKLLITDKSSTVYLSTAEAGVITVSTDNITMYLPAASNNSGLRYIIKQTASHSTGTKVDGSGSETIDGSTQLLCAAQYDMLDVICDGSNWHIIGKMGTWA